MTMKGRARNQPGSVENDMKFPDYDEKRHLPKGKMPDCDTCEEDELIFINKYIVKCMKCGKIYEIYR